VSLGDHYSEQSNYLGQSGSFRASLGWDDRPGGSALARYRARRAAEWRNWLGSLPWRAASVVGGGFGTGFMISALIGPGLGEVAGVIVATAVGWGLRFRASQDAQAWRLGAKGERRTARILARLEQDGFVAFHDLAVPGSPANVDHLVVGPTGVFVIDSKLYRGVVRMGLDGRLWYGGRSLDRVLGTLCWEAQQVAEALAGGPEIRVYPVLCMHQARLPWLEELTVDGIPVLAGSALEFALRVPRQPLTPAQVAWLCGQVRAGFRPAV
jgi:Nuclease-related domain